RESPCRLRSALTVHLVQQLRLSLLGPKRSSLISKRKHSSAAKHSGTKAPAARHTLQRRTSHVPGRDNHRTIRSECTCCYGDLSRPAALQAARGRACSRGFPDGCAGPVCAVRG